MWKAFSIIVVLVLIAIGLTIYRSSTPQKLPGFSMETPNPIVTAQTDSENKPGSEIVAQNLQVPWALAFLPNGDILVTERKGSIKIIDHTNFQNIKEIANIKVNQTGESGLHGIAVHPKYPESPYIYIYYTYSTQNDSSQNRVSQFILDNDNLRDEKIIVDQIPGAIFHDGGRIKFGPDGALYITTGDALEPSLSQNKNSLAGKILRVEIGKKAEFFSYGHRNPQGIAWDNQNRLWEVEHGQSATDEINLIEQNKNFGWPTIRGDQTKEGMITPKLQSGNETWAPAGLTFYKNLLYFGGLRGEALFQFNPDTLELKQYFKNQFGRIREVVLGPDDMLYITTSNLDGRGKAQSGDDKLIRINPNSL